MTTVSGGSGHLFAARALLPDGWRQNVLLEWNAGGMLTGVSTGAGSSDTVSGKPIERARGPVLPGMPNLHSHAFQRAMAGLTELRTDPSDSFWSWRTLMYRFAQRLAPQELSAVSRYLYIEMLLAGYTSVCEFHYVHHAAGGTPYANPVELAQTLVESAGAAGIGQTLLPVLYEYGGFGQQAPLPHQGRFVSSADWILDAVSRLRRDHPADGARQYGVAPHSLRAVSTESLQRLVAELHRTDPTAPIHIHVAEQTKEVDDCLQAFGQRPVQRLLDSQAVDERWCLVHATHMDAAEYDGVAASGAVVGLCPTTEANLGDGFFDAVRYLGVKGRWGIGSDSHISVNPWSELRWLEYGQRLIHRGRNVLASEDAPAVADRLFQAAVHGGASASGRAIDGLRVGHRADMVVLAADHPAVAEMDDEHRLSGLVFGETGGNPVRDVLVGGTWRVRDGRHPLQESALHDYRKAVRSLLA